MKQRRILMVVAVLALLASLGIGVGGGVVAGMVVGPRAWGGGR